MKRSPELETLSRTFLTALTQDGAAPSSFIDHNDALTVIGTDPAEWWAGYDTASRMMAQQREEAQGVTIDAGDPVAHTQGDVGWVATQPVMHLPDGTAVPFRVTMVCRKVDGAWKVIQTHASFGVSNEDTVGKELTVQ
ncbi:MAG: nuclear transport factor 2 family protein [Spiribacter salinus]|uniref:Nuclear transport factor 2 family protein n=1 Tax=Spiribacter salinus TaxID=1335746 RepID=A0A540VNI4_9GAMM|nr:MAG: nuclear transport factor 2 family protein [Spiribacter salinus]